MKIEILLSTYNGSLYLAQQIDSLLCQSNHDWHLTIRDDGSSDNTLEIIKGYTTRHPSLISLLTDSLGNLGAAYSFEQLLLHSPSADYYMFCDQDDVWMPEKIEETLALAMRTERDHPGKAILAFTDLLVTNENLDPIGSSFKILKANLAHCQKFKYLCVGNCMAGCTMMFNNTTRQLVLPFARNIPVHDLWVAALVARDGKTAMLNRPTILYRQHTGNAIGVHTATSRHYIHRVLHPFEMFEEFNKLKPLLTAVNYGGMARFWWNKTIYFFLRQL